MTEQNAAYMKFIRGKINSHNIIKGENDSWNTLSAIYRMLYLKNNYCLYDSDKILYVAENSILVDRVRDIYEKLKRDMEFDYITLFSMGTNRVEFSTMEDIIKSYFENYTSKKAGSLRLAGEGDRNQLVKSSLAEVKEHFGGSKLLKEEYIAFFTDEIDWMKSQGYTSEDTYQNCSRNGRGGKKGEGPTRLNRNSRERDGVFRVYNIYQKKLHEYNLVDREDRDRLAFEEAKKRRIREYTHLIVDNSRAYTKNQLEISLLLKDGRSYGEALYLYNPKYSAKPRAFLTKPSRLLELSGGERIKSFYFRKPFESPMLSLLEQDIQQVKPQVFNSGASLESFDFISLKNNREFRFTRDISRKDSIVLQNEDDVTEINPNEMRELPVFSDIAAGEPIYMNPEVEDTFYLPQIWVRGSDDHFLLRVKGDSMIGAGINDGDYVVIKSSPSAQHRDIVAVDLDGSATLKRLWIKDRSAMLMPENEKYRPIPIGEDGAHILGIAVGILKGRH